MVMVTHDVALKSYADRVIWMRDGKISRTELISAEKKKETLHKLDAELEAIKENKKQKFTEAITELRQPTDYKTNPKYMKRGN